MHATPSQTQALKADAALLDTIRYAALHRLCVELGYRGAKRIIEPYALREAADGGILLSARRADTHRMRTYRLDRVEFVHLTPLHFEPLFTSEMTGGGPLQEKEDVQRRRAPLEHW